MRPIPQALRLKYTVSHVHSRHWASTQNTSEIRHRYTYITQDTTTILQALMSHIISRSPWQAPTQSRNISFTNPLRLPLQSRREAQTQINSHLVPKLDTGWGPSTFPTQRSNIPRSNTCPSTPEDRRRKLQKWSLRALPGRALTAGVPSGGGEKK